jgi:O-antigen/teichoic acid export membrane protein
MHHRLRALLRRKFVRDTLTLQAGKLVNTGLSLLVWILTIRLMGIDNYGVWGLMLSFFHIWQAFQLTGVGMSTTNRLPIAIGQDNPGEILNLMGYYVKIMLAWSAFTLLMLALFAPAAAAALYDGDPRIGQLAAWFALTVAADALYTLVIIALQSRRLMRQMALLQNLNQVALALCVVVAMLVAPTPESMVAARIVYSYGTLLLAFAFYKRLRGAAAVPFPSLRAVFARAVGVPVRGYWRSDLLMALDKNISNLYTQIPVTLVGVLSGETAAGYLRTALDGVTRAGILTEAVLLNMQAVVPQAVGRGDYAWLRDNFGRVLRGMALLGVAFYTLLGLSAPLLLPLLLGAEAAPAVPAFVVLMGFGVITAVGGIFGPLYRAFDLLGAAFGIKLITTLVMLPLGVFLIQRLDAVGGAWLINGLYALSVGLTALWMLPALQRRAHNQDDLHKELTQNSV